MSTGDDDLGRQVGELVDALRALEREFEPRTEGGRPRPPSPRELMRFTSDVAIPAAILVLRTNVEALKLLQRALRMADGRPPTTGASGEVRDRAERLSRASLSRLDGALADLQDAVEGRPEDEDARELLDEARRLREDVEDRLVSADGDSDAETGARAGGIEDDADEPRDVPVDVDAELRSIKDEFDDDGGSGDGDDA
ncbi:DUF7547 family protein [Halomicrobium urmianum]|uniref:DUF7547 family protein n=1 Tax=Halomicrobium urmianum TaxID=1586233 RepID=UPI001CDA32B0|nr:hypothetical protein [Halomicrobium urmianum]